MKNFFILFKCEENSVNHDNWKKLSDEIQKEKLSIGKKKLEHWFEKNKDFIVIPMTEFEDKLLYVDNNGLNEVKRKMGAFMQIKANSLEDAAGLFKSHPHFSIFPGDGIEVVECK